MAIGVMNKPKPAQAPEGWPAWPVWFSGFAFQHNRKFGGLPHPRSHRGCTAAHLPAAPSGQGCSRNQHLVTYKKGSENRSLFYFLSSHYSLTTIS
jgi:hypothetical protein